MKQIYRKRNIDRLEPNLNLKRGNIALNSRVCVCVSERVPVHGR